MKQEMKGQGRATSPAQIEPLPPARFRQVKAAHQSYYRWRRLGRLTRTAFGAMAILYLIWLVPWLPSGLDTDDYTPELAFTVYLLGGVAITGVLALAFQELARRRRESLAVWAAVYDDATGLHSRTYLYDRLALQCEQAEGTGAVFSVIILKIRINSAGSGPPPRLSNAMFQKLAELLDDVTRPTDPVALLSASELAIIGIGVDRENRHALLEGLRSTVADELPLLLGRPALINVIGGVSTYGVEGRETNELIQAARAAAILGLPRRTRAA